MASAICVPPIRSHSALHPATLSASSNTAGETETSSGGLAQALAQGPDDVGECHGRDVRDDIGFPGGLRLVRNEADRRNQIVDREQGPQVVELAKRQRHRQRGDPQQARQIALQARSIDHDRAQDREGHARCPHGLFRIELGASIGIRRPGLDVLAQDIGRGGAGLRADRRHENQAGDAGTPPRPAPVPPWPDD